MSKPAPYSFFITTSKGLEECLAEELKTLGAPATLAPFQGGIACEGTLEMAYRFCLWSRIANRVLLFLKAFDAYTPEALYAGVQSIDWSDHMTEDSSFCVDFNLSSSQITHSHYAALKVKDAIVDQFRAKFGARPTVDTFRPDLRINVYLYHNEAHVSIDLAGDSLHKRGYRDQGGGAAPLKENLAAGILQLTGFNTNTPALLDPMCGSGTLAIEAGWIVQKRAPALGRRYFGFQGWQGHIPSLWRRLVEEANDLLIRNPAHLPRIQGHDHNPKMVDLANLHAKKSELDSIVHFSQKEFSDCEPTAETGILVINPPYGERLGEEEELKGLYQVMGNCFKQRFAGWTAYVLTGNLELAKAIHLKPARRFVLFNGPIECRLLKYEMFQGSGRKA
jgi:23S rRNA (guanine2445-N2)-methyltransferase / 23S rRNA (guanine2069-N7)-methyltransferase